MRFFLAIVDGILPAQLASQAPPCLVGTGQPRPGDDEGSPCPRPLVGSQG